LIHVDTTTIFWLNLDTSVIFQLNLDTSYNIWIMFQMGAERKIIDHLHEAREKIFFWLPKRKTCWSR